MNTFAGESSAAPRSVFRALWAREFRAAQINRYLQVFCALALSGRATAVLFSEDAQATGFFLLQIALYFVSLFALLAGVSSALAEREEWPLLFAQPLARGAFVIRKFCDLTLKDIDAARELAFEALPATAPDRPDGHPTRPDQARAGG